MGDPYKLANAFVADFRSMEYTLKRSGFLRINTEIAEADWGRFAQKLGEDFFDHVVRAGLATTLIGDPPRRLLANMEWSPPTTVPLTNVAQLMINGVCRVRNSYIHGEKFTGGPERQWERDERLVTEAHAILVEAMKFSSAVRTVAEK
ncbi:hypothetical protein [Microbaculum sp. FT89]|uniref:hypothetical protein n=1 Tax=Microbaculum sp. FT89 TaxID=3447298 RepID=UPI003F52B504